MNFISTGSDVAAVLGGYMNASRKVSVNITIIGALTAAPQFYSDMMLLKDGNLHGKALLDAAVNVVSVFGLGGAAVSLLYTGSQQMARGLQYVDTEVQRKMKDIIRNPYRW